MMSRSLVISFWEFCSLGWPVYVQRARENELEVSLRGCADATTAVVA